MHDVSNCIIKKLINKLLGYVFLNRFMPEFFDFSLLSFFNLGTFSMVLFIACLSVCLPSVLSKLALELVVCIRFRIFDLGASVGETSLRIFVTILVKFNRFVKDVGSDSRMAPSVS